MLGCICGGLIELGIVGGLGFLVAGITHCVACFWNHRILRKPKPTCECKCHGEENIEREEGDSVL